MDELIKDKLNENNIKFPDIWDPDKGLKFFMETDTLDMPVKLGMTKKAFAALTLDTFPELPKKTSIKSYLSGLIDSIPKRKPGIMIGGRPVG